MVRERSEAIAVAIEAPASEQPQLKLETIKEDSKESVNESPDIEKIGIPSRLARDTLISRPISDLTGKPAEEERKFAVQDGEIIFIDTVNYEGRKREPRTNEKLLRNYELSGATSRRDLIDLKP